MTDDTAKSLIELARRAFGQEYEEQNTFDLELAGLGVENMHSFPAEVFTKGNYTGKEHDLNAIMDKIGEKLIAQAKKDHIDIAKLAGVTDLDFNKNGKLEAREVGAMFLAATMDTHVELAGVKTADKGTVVTELMGTVREYPAAAPLSKDAGEAAKLIAKQLLRDNGATIAAESDADFNTKMKKNPSVSKRDTSDEYRC